VTRPSLEIAAESVAMMRETIGPVAFFKQVLVVDRLPKTRSGKILRGTIQKITDGIEWKMPATIEDPGVRAEISHALNTIGYGTARTEMPQG
jgi:propionyl-CoA synthetase